MARKGRIKSSTGIYHVALRGQDKLFFGAADYEQFLELLRKYFDKKDASLYAYSQEEGKVHLAFYTRKDLNLLIKPFCTSYARYINRTHNKSGKLFYDRYMSEPVEDMDCLYNVISFIHKRKCKHSSILEYQRGEDLCDIKKISKSVDIKAISENAKALAMRDDYQAMSDEELLDYLIYINAKKNKNLSDEEKKEIIDLATIHSNISKSRLQRIFGLTYPKTSAKALPKVKKEEKPKPRQKEEPKPQPKKQELSVWLL